MKKNGLKDTTIKATGRRLRIIKKNVSLNNPEKVKEFIARLDAKPSYKKLLCISYDKYVKYVGLTWTKPNYHAKSELPYVATEKNIDMIIGCSSKHYMPIFTVLKKTGMRPIELHQLTERRYNNEKGIIDTPETKYGNPRRLKIDNKTLAMFNTYIAKYGFSMPSSNKMKNAWKRARDKAYDISHDTTIKQIRLYDLRHFYATMLYHKTRDILLVKQQLGHKSIKTTLVYTHLVAFEDDEWTCKTATNIKEATALIEAGFEYVTEIDGTKLFRKRK